MGKMHFRIILAIAVLAIAALACEGSFSTANIADAWMSTDPDGNNRTSTYSQDATFYVQVDLRNAPDDTVLKAVWTAVDVENTDPNYVMNESEYTSGDALIYFQLENTSSLWPTGEYKVDIYLNDTLGQSVTFYVE